MYLESEDTQRTFFEGSLRSRSRLFLPSERRSNEELVRGVVEEVGGGEKEEKEKIVAKEEAESLMIFLITARHVEREVGAEGRRETDGGGRAV